MLADDEIVLNRWAADDLEAKVGDAITVTFYEPESTHGQLREHEPPPQFKLRAIVELGRRGRQANARGRSEADARAARRHRSGVDQRLGLAVRAGGKNSPAGRGLLGQVRTTPKAFVSLATAKRLWPSRWGTISLLRLPGGASLQRVAFGSEYRRNSATSANSNPPTLGMTFLPVKQHGLAAASGTTPFDALFLGFSFFLIAAAVMLIALLFQLGIQQRAGELGTLAAVGVGRKRIAGIAQPRRADRCGDRRDHRRGGRHRLRLADDHRPAHLVARGDFDAVSRTARHAGASLVIGWLIGVVVSWLTIRWSIRRLLRTPANRLLARRNRRRATHSGEPSASDANSGRLSASRSLC